MNNAMPIIESIRIRGFRSLADVELTGLSSATVLIGPNGSGKSNILLFLDMLHHMLRYRRLGWFVERNGGIGAQLFGGDRSGQIAAEITLKEGDERYDYRFVLEYAYMDQFFFGEESFRRRSGGRFAEAEWQDLGSDHLESNLVLAAKSNEFPHLDRAAARSIVRTLGQCVVYQFHNTDARSSVRRDADVFDGVWLGSHGDDLAAVLHHIEREDHRRYERICRYIRRILPGFDQFDLEEHHGKVALRWKADWSDYGFGAHLTSDGSLRTFALVTLLNAPTDMLPDVVIVDEPELGLHPAAVSLIGGMMQSLSAHRQIIVATQSPLLVDSFPLEQIRVLELREGRTSVLRYDPAQYKDWLADYSTGELWEKNLLGGRP